MVHELHDDIIAHLEKGESLVVATIVTRDGSAPRSAGAEMLVFPDGSSAGTIGGGGGEAVIIATAKDTLADGRRRLVDIGMSGQAASGADLICGGRVQVFLDRVTPLSLPLYRELSARYRDGLPSFLATPVDGDGMVILVQPELPAGDVALETLRENPDAATVLDIAGTRYAVRPVRPRPKLILAGGGHVSHVTARVADIAGWEVVVLDDREEYANPARFPWLPASNIHVVPAFENCFKAGVLGFDVTDTTAIAVMTRGHQYDADVLAQALRTWAGYIGMIGSRRKREAVYDRMRELGFEREDIGRVHSPIGLAIGAETPEEIAVSVMAEIISERAAKRMEA
ncbi:MAG: XdhC family protein [Planctomycetaceae bacterium]|nr:XdhC family protein [Planctomycetaceae bacterium]